jgi:hypothetical protein
MDLHRPNEPPLIPIIACRKQKLEKCELEKYSQIASFATLTAYNDS